MTKHKNLTRHLCKLNSWSSLSKDSNQYQLVSIPPLLLNYLPLTNVLARIGSSQGNYLPLRGTGGFQILQIAFPKNVFCIEWNYT